MNRRILFTIGMAGCLAAASAGPVVAASTTWTTKLGARLRLIGGETPAAMTAPAQRIAGLEIQLQPGWKTYWRSPGDGGGVPPSIEWKARSSNIAAATIGYPAPQRFADSLGDSVGYHDRVVFPVVLTAVDPTQPLTLAADVFLGVCNDICVPVEMAFDLRLMPGEAPTPAEAAILQRARDAVPVTETAEASPTLPKITDFAVSAAGKGTRIVVTVAPPQGSARTDLYVDSAEGTYIPLPGPGRPNADGTITFVIDTGTVSRPPDLAGKTLRITLVTDKGAVEAERTLPK